MKKLITSLLIAATFFVSCKKEVYYNVTTMVQPEGSGDIMVTPSVGSVLEGTTVSFQANPKGDYVFTGWSGSLSGTENPKTVTITSDLSVIANFTLREYPLNISVEGEGTVNEQVISTKTDYGSGTVVELKAQPSDHWLFDHWEGDLNGNTNPVQIAVTSPKAVKAVFVKKMYDLTVSIEGEGAVSETVIETKSGTYQEGTIVELAANPSTGWAFDRWEGDVSGKENPVQVTVSSPKALTAVFVPILHDLTVDVQGKGIVNERILETKSESFLDGTVVELTAIPDEFWAFDHWEGLSDTVTNPAVITVTESKNIIAVFVENDPGILFTDAEFVDPYVINHRLGLGLNVSSQLDAYREDGEYNIPDENYWGNPNCTQEFFHKVAAAGFKSVRIPITWMGSFGPAPDYIIDEDRLNRVEEVVGYAEKAGLNAIINMQHDDAGPHQDGHRHMDDFWIDPGKAAANPEYNVQVKGQLKALWTQIARKFRDKGDFLMFESFNEPGSSFFWSWATDSEKDAHQAEYECLSEWNQVFVDAVRSTGGNNAKRWLLIVGAAAKERNLDRLTIPKDYVSNNRLILSIHFWEPEGYVAGLYDEWGHTAQILNSESARFDEEFISSEMTKYKEKYLEKGIPICIDEMGCNNRDNERGKAFQLYYLEYVVRAARLNGLSAFLWEDGGRNYANLGCSLFLHDTGDFIDYAEEIVDVVRNAAYSDDPEYTLKSVYDRAPFQDPDADKVIDMNISDPVFRQYLISTFDRDANGFLSIYESRRITRIELNNNNVQLDRLVSINGIESLPNLKSLFIVGDEKQKGGLKMLELSSCAQLQEICIASCELSHVSISDMPKLESLDLSDNPITSINISECPIISQLLLNNTLLSFSDLPELSNLPLTSLHLSTVAHKMPADYLRQFTNLRYVNFSGYEGKSIDLSLNNCLEQIWCFDMCNITVLDLSDAPNLCALYCSGCPNLDKIIVHPDVDIDSLEVVKDGHTSIVHTH